MSGHHCRETNNLMLFHNRHPIVPRLQRRGPRVTMRDSRSICLLWTYRPLRTQQLGWKRRTYPCPLAATEASVVQVAVAVLVVFVLVVFLIVASEAVSSRLLEKARTIAPMTESRTRRCRKLHQQRHRKLPHHCFERTPTFLIGAHRTTNQRFPLRVEIAVREC